MLFPQNIDPAAYAFIHLICYVHIPTEKFQATQSTLD